MPLPLLLTDDEHVPLYLQLVHQIRYQITSRELVAGAQLPPVRELSQQLRVNSGTVALAYRTLQHEGLVEGRRGRGTFVATLPNGAARTDLRQALFTEAVDELITRAYALGFDPASIRQNIGTQLQRQLRRVPLVLVMSTAAAAEKYKALVALHLPGSVVPDIHALSIDQLEGGDPITTDAYRHAFFTLTFNTLVPRVDAALRRLSLRSEVVGFTARLTDDTKARMRTLPRGGRYVLVTESRNVASGLTLLAQYSALEVRELHVLTELSSQEQFAREAGNLHIYTFGVKPLLDANAVPAEQRMELEFTLSEESIHQLRALFDQPRPGTPHIGDQ